MIIFKHVVISGSSHYCECCGSYCASGDAIYVNNEMVWEKYFDGHMGGRQTEDLLVNCVLKAWHAEKVYQLEREHTEEARLAWPENQPSRVSAFSVEDWNERKQQYLKFHKEDYEQIKEDCANLPYDEALQIKMIALWIESQTGEKITIEEDSYYEDDGAQLDYYTYNNE